jgi:maltodextrin utilization protein YvdJ
MSTTPTFLTDNMTQNGVDQFYSVMSGTSMACPMVTAQAALILSKNPTLNAVQVKEIIEKSAKNIGDRRIFGAGLIQINQSLSMVQAPAAQLPANPAPGQVAAQTFRR